MVTVWKYELGDALPPTPGGYAEFSMPKGAKVLRVARQPHGIPALWARVDTEATPETRKFGISGTGWPIPADAVYRGTFESGPYVWHVFEVFS